MTRAATLELCLSADHRSAQGHFPGNPVIPGAVLLDEALFVIGESLGANLSACRIGAAKFLHPVRPGDTLRIELRELHGEIEFTCKVGEVIVMKGEVAWSRGLRG